MNWMRELARRLSMLVHRRQFDADLEEEMRLHLELRQQEQIESGVKKDDARAAARRHFGNVTSLQERSRTAWGWVWFENMVEDIRYGLRTLRKSPGFSAVAILTIAIGIGATTAIFSVVDATLLHPLPYPKPEQLVRIEDDLPGVGAQDVGMSVPELHDFQRSGIFEYVSPIGGGDVNLTGASQPVRISFLNVTPNYFAVLGVKAQLGRTFDPEDQTPGFNLEAILSDGLWKRAFAADPGILGKSLRLDNDLYRVVGVMPAGFYDPGRTPEERNTEIWLASGFAAPPAPPPVRHDHFLQAAIATNAVDESLNRRRKLKKYAVRRYEADALVDTGAVRCFIPVQVMERLGVLAEESAWPSMPMAERNPSLSRNRSSSTSWGADALEEALVLGDEVLIGQTVLEKLDLLADCANGRLIPNPAHPDRR